MKNSTGPVDITTEILVSAGDIGIPEITKLANMMYVQGSFPSELNTSIFITLPKMNGKMKYEKTPHIQLDESCEKVSASHCKQNN